jgi:hypothetical protein
VLPVCKGINDGIEQSLAALGDEERKLVGVSLYERAAMSAREREKQYA